MCLLLLLDLVVRFTHVVVCSCSSCSLEWMYQNFIHPADDTFDYLTSNLFNVLWTFDKMWQEFKSIKIKNFGKKKEYGWNHRVIKCFFFLLFLELRRNNFWFLITTSTATKIYQRNCSKTHERFLYINRILIQAQTFSK